MATTQQSTGSSLTERIVSIDVFRGLTMLVMLFVNDIGDRDLGHIHNAPWWLEHMDHLDARIDGMTIPDAIIPAFLFVVGLSIPIALGRRIARGDSLAKLSWHIVARTAALIFIGLCMANGCYGTPLDEQAMGISAAWWRILMFAGVILVWNRYPDVGGAMKWLFVILRLVGAGLLVYLLVIYRAEGGHGEIIWMQSRWYGVIGQIGWAYLVAAFIWLLCRDYGTAVMGAMALLVALAGAVQLGEPSWWQINVGGWRLPSLHLFTGSASMIAAGMAVATLFRPNSTVTTPGRRIFWMLLFAAGFAAAGFALRPYWGIHKSGGTPPWILCSLAIACAIYALLHWLVDVKKITAWTALVKPAGSNTLLMYMTPYIFYSILGILGVDYLQAHFNVGWPGVARSAVLAISLVGATDVLTRCGIRLRL